MGKDIDCLKLVATWLPLFGSGDSHACWCSIRYRILPLYQSLKGTLNIKNLSISLTAA